MCANAFGANYLRAIDGAETAMFELERGMFFLDLHPALAFCWSRDQQRMLRLRWPLRSVITRAIAPFGHELVELGPVLGKA